MPKPRREVSGFQTTKTMRSSVLSSKPARDNSYCTWPHFDRCQKRKCPADPMKCKLPIIKRNISRLEIEEALALAGRFSMNDVRDVIFNMLTGYTDGKHEEAE